MVKKTTFSLFIILGSLLSSCVFYTLKYSDQFTGFKLPISKYLNSELQIRTDGFYSLKVRNKKNTDYTKKEY